MLVVPLLLSPQSDALHCSFSVNNSMYSMSDTITFDQLTSQMATLLTCGCLCYCRHQVKLADAVKEVAALMEGAGYVAKGAAGGQAGDAVGQAGDAVYYTNKMQQHQAASGSRLKKMAGLQSARSSMAPVAYVVGFVSDCRAGMWLLMV